MHQKRRRTPLGDHSTLLQILYSLAWSGASLPNGVSRKKTRFQNKFKSMVISNFQKTQKTKSMVVGGLNRLIGKIHTTWSAASRPQRPQTLVRTVDNINDVDALVLSQDGHPQTHRKRRDVLRMQGLLPIVQTFELSLIIAYSNRTAHTPAHWARETVALLGFAYTLWPPNRSDFNPVDYEMWSFAH